MIAVIDYGAGNIQSVVKALAVTALLQTKRKNF